MVSRCWPSMTSRASGVSCRGPLLYCDHDRTHEVCLRLLLSKSPVPVVGTPHVQVSLGDVAHVVQSGSHWSSWFQTYGRWNIGMM